ncbi:hypothetical protein [Caldiplasma sukawensis]
MAKIMKSAYRYPFFFLGLLLIEIGGLYYKFVSADVMNTAYFVIVGFVIFLLSLAIP